MNQNVNPVTAFLIILVSLSLIGLVFWARGESLRTGGPDQMQLDNQGNLYIHVADALYQLDPARKLLNSYRLPDLGIYDLVGDMAFFSNGDMLVRLGKFEPGLLESLLRYLRVTETRQPVTHHENEGLYRCNLQTVSCVPFGSGKLDFDSAFHLSIDTVTDTVYLSDTGRHKLRKYNAQGDELAVQDNGYKFPNQILFTEGRLYVADTNHHAMQIAETADDRFGDILDTHSVRNKALGNNTWTYSFAKVADNWWINNMAASMSNGSVTIYDNSWRFVRTINLPADADPIDMVTLDDRVLITDLNNIRIYQLNHQGELTDDTMPDDIQDKLSQLQKDRMHYRNLSAFFIVIFVLFLAGGFIVAIRQARRAEEPHVATAQKIFIDINNPNIRWIPLNKRKMRLLKFAFLFPLLLIPIIPLMFMSAGKISNTLPVIAMLLFVILIPFLTLGMFKIGLGILDDVLVIKKSGREFAAARGKDIFFSDTHILIDQVYIPFSHQQLLFETEPVVKEVMPLLRDATYVQGGQMMNMILKRQRPWRIVVLFVVALAFIAILFGDIYK